MYDTFLVRCSGCRKWHPYTSSPMIRDELWRRISNEHWEGGKWVSELLCLECMEARLRRKVTPKDFGMYAGSYHNEQFVKNYYKKSHETSKA